MSLKTAMQVILGSTETFSDMADSGISNLSDSHFHIEIVGDPVQIFSDFEPLFHFVNNGDD